MVTLFKVRPSPGTMYFQFDSRWVIGRRKRLSFALIIILELYAYKYYNMVLVDTV